MDDIEKLKNQVDDADEERLREILKEWIDISEDFREFAGRKLNPTAEAIDYDAELAHAIEREANTDTSQKSNISVFNWRNIYHYKVKPWTDNADELATPELLRLSKAIIERLALEITDEDFNGDIWDGDDHSTDISSIMNALANTLGLILVRKDLSDELLQQLRQVIEDAQKSDITTRYMRNTCDIISELIETRAKTGEVTIGMFDYIINKNLGNKGAEWICRKIDFCESRGLMEEAWKLAEENIKYPQVAIKLYLTLMNDDKWKEALELIDLVMDMDSNAEVRTYRFGHSYDWLGMKQQILREYGSVNDRIDNLKQLFLSNNSDSEQYFLELKNLVPSESWKTFYTELLSEVKGYGAIEKIAPFLEKEGEYAWLLRLLRDNSVSDPTDYRTPLKYAAILISYYETETKEILNRTFRAYASSRFLPKQKVKPERYRCICADLKKLTEIGAHDVMEELIRIFKNLYGTRPSFMAELRRIRFKG